MGAHIKQVIASMKLWEQLQKELSQDKRQLCSLGKFPPRKWLREKELKHLMKRTTDPEFKRFALQLIELNKLSKDLE